MVATPIDRCPNACLRDWVLVNPPGACYRGICEGGGTDANHNHDYHRNASRLFLGFLDLRVRWLVVWRSLLEG